MAAMSAMKFWGPSLVLLGSSVSALGCRVPGARIEPVEGGAERAANEPARVVREKPGPKPRGFAVVDAEIGGDGVTLELEFTHPLGSTQGVDPNDFRLSVGLAYAYPMYAYAYYYDPGYMADADELARFVQIGARDHVLELTLAEPFPLSYCVEIAREVQSMQQEPGVKAKGGIFLHYAPGETPLRDKRGKALAPAAEQWVLHREQPGEDEDPGEMYVEGPKARRAFDGAIPVRCGPELPPGPR